MASVRVNDNFSEHLGIMRQLYQEYQKQDDLDAVLQVNELLSSMQSICEQREGGVQHIIAELSQQVEAARVLSVYPEPEEAHARARTRVEDQKEQVQERLQKAAASCTAAAKAAAEEEPTIRSQLSLFAHISKIAWRLDQREAVAGTVSDPKSGDVRPFHFNPQSMSEFELVNKLWQLV